MATWGVLNAAMLIGLIGATVPIIIHFLNRSRDPVIDWGAMQFLELGRKARRKIRITELLLMLARMALLALVALALARPYRGEATGKGTGTEAVAATGGGGGGGAKDLVIVIDGSAGMGREAGGTTPRSRAVATARRLVKSLKPGDSVALLVAGSRVKGVIDPPSFDMAKVDAALGRLDPMPRPRTPDANQADLPAALGEAFRVLERSGNPAREVVVLTDGRRSSWRPGESTRWALVRDLWRRLPVRPGVWSVALGSTTPPEAPDGSVGPPGVSRALVTPGLPMTVTADVDNAGPGPLTRTALLLIDGRSTTGQAQVVGPIPQGGRARLTFRTTLPSPGSHLLTVRLDGGEDSLPTNDEASVAVEVAAALPALLVDGEPSNEPLSGETDFLRAALAPTGDDTPQVRATVVKADGLTSSALQGQGVLVLANVERLELDQATAVSRFLDGGGGVLVAPGDRVDPAAYASLPWMPAKLGERTGDFASRKAVAHPAPATFTGPVLPMFAQGDTPPLASADLFGYRRLELLPGASVSARLDTGEPWAVERALGPGKGRVLVLAGPIDAEGGTLPVNPDFVPLVHEWAFYLAGGSEPRASRPGEPVVFDLQPALPAGVTSLPVLTPSGGTGRAVVIRSSGVARARFEGTAEPGVYRLSLPDPPGGFAYATVRNDSTVDDAAPLEPAEADRLAEGWPLHFEPDPDRLVSRIFSGGSGGRRELWRGLVLAALGGLCVEIYLTRKLVRGQGLMG